MSAATGRNIDEQSAFSPRWGGRTETAMTGVTSNLHKNNNITIDNQSVESAESKPGQFPTKLRRHTSKMSNANTSNFDFVSDDRSYARKLKAKSFRRNALKGSIEMLSLNQPRLSKEDLVPKKGAHHSNPGID